MLNLQFKLATNFEQNFRFSLINYFLTNENDTISIIYQYSFHHPEKNIIINPFFRI